MNGIYFSYKLLDRVENWEEALYKTAKDALNDKVINALYLKDVVDTVNQAKTLLVINENTILFHAAPSEYVRKDCLAYLSIKEGVKFFDKTIHHVFLFGAQTPNEHIKLLKWITKFTLEALTSPSMYECKHLKAYFKEKLKIS
ncbi:MAG: PTS sugar transporter subunit IIA [Candidatus Izemoplasmataceae bacterium]